VNSTPDISHTGQLTFTIECIPGCQPVESFIKFIPIFSHGAKNLADNVVDFINENQIPLSNCPGQSYVNASNMSGNSTGLQSRVHQLNEFVICVLCVRRILNLVGAKAAECYRKTVNFFDFVQRLYSSFLSSYTSLEYSDIITKSLNSNTPTLRHFSPEQ